MLCHVLGMCLLLSVELWLISVSPMLCFRHTMNHWWRFRGGKKLSSDYYCRGQLGVSASPTHLVSKLAGCSVSSWERECSSDVTEKPRWLSQCPLLPPTTASPRVGARLGLFFLLFFWNVKSDDGCNMQTSTAHPCVTVPPMTPWGSVLWAPASCPYLSSVLKPGEPESERLHALCL